MYYSSAMSKPFLELKLPDIELDSDWLNDISNPTTPLTPLTPPAPRTPRTPRTPQTPRSLTRTRQLLADENDHYETAPSSPLAQVMDQILNTNTPPPPIPPKSPDRKSSPSSPYFLYQLAKKPRIPSNFSETFKIHELLSGTVPKDQNLDPWMVCMMVAQFDHEIGPDLKLVEPTSVQLSEDDFRTICFSALPERSSNKEIRSQFHTFRFASSTFPGTELHGFALFSQQRTSSSARGYSQESLVIISKLDFPQLFNACLQLTLDAIENKNSQATLGSPTFNLDEKIPIINACISDVSQWPPPDPNATLELPFLGTAIMLSIPLYESTPLVGTIELDTSSVNFHSMGRKPMSSSDPSFLESSLTLSYPQHDALVLTASEPAATWDYLINFITDPADIYILYEYMLLAKPIVVFASSPHHCSSFISLLLDLIRPIPYAGRVREYVTIHTCPNGELDPSGGITGVTNPFLMKGVLDSETLVFVLSPSPIQNTAGPFHYYRANQDGVSVLKRKGATVPREHSSARSPTQVPKNYGPRESWASKLLGRYMGPKETKLEKSRISSPLVSTFVKMPSNLTPITPDVPQAATPITAAKIAAHSNKQGRPKAGASDWDEGWIKELMRTSRRAIIKERLLFPDQKFLATLARLINKTAAEDLSATDKSIDFAIRFHFATITSKFLGPLACYLDPTPAASHRTTQQSEQQLAFSQTEFMNDLVSPNSTVPPRNKASSRSRHRHSMIVTSTSHNYFAGSSTASGDSDNDGTLHPFHSNEKQEPGASHLRSSAPRRSLAHTRALNGSTVSFASSGTAPAPTTSSSIYMGGENRRASMLALSSIGLKFSASGVPDHHSSAPASSLSRANTTGGAGGSNRRTSLAAGKRLSALFIPPSDGDDDDSIGTGAGAGSLSVGAGAGPSPSAAVSPRHHEQANLHKQVIYKTFLGTPNFKSWLKMNNVV